MKRVHTALVDDIDGQSPATSTVNFAVDGVNYEIDLSDEHAAELAKLWEPWIAAARRVGGRRTRGTVAGSVASRRNQLQAVREWAQENGHAVAARGRIPESVMAAYDAAH